MPGDGWWLLPACAHPLHGPRLEVVRPCRCFAPNLRRSRRRRVEAEIVEAAGLRTRAINSQDFDTYQRLTDRIDDLLGELKTLREVR